MKWPYVIKMPAIGKSWEKRWAIFYHCGGFLNVVPFIVEFAIFV
jgi:hypothetical protein